MHGAITAPKHVRHAAHVIAGHLMGLPPSLCRRLHAAAGQGSSMGPIQELHPKDLQEILERMSQGGADDVQLIDVREEFEHQAASLPGFKLMPMSRHGSTCFKIKC